MKLTFSRLFFGGLEMEQSSNSCPKLLYPIFKYLLTHLHTSPYKTARYSSHVIQELSIGDRTST